MKVTAYKTHKITAKDKNILEILDTYLPPLQENSVVAITSKIIAICEGSLMDAVAIDKKSLIKKEASRYLPADKNKYNITLTIKRDLLIPTAGIDESNSNGNLILWPRDPQADANRIRAHLKKKFSLANLGVIITDSKTTPLRYGVTGMCIAHSGFVGLNDYIGTKDLFGRTMNVTKVNVMDGLASAAVLVMGEGSEQTPLAVIEDVAFVKFQDRYPTEVELKDLVVPPELDLYHELLTSVNWEKGEGK